MVLFLDIDGVFNRIPPQIKESTWFQTGFHMEPEIISMFNQLLDENPEFELVISSSWRNDMNDLQKQLELSGFNHWHKVIGKTEWNDKPRGQQIQNFIQERGIDKFMVIDDDDFDIVVFIDSEDFIHTKSEIGLNKEHIERLKRKLNEKKCIRNERVGSV